MSLQEALTIPGVEQPAWTVRDRFDPAAAALADRHYSREKVGSPQVGGPGYLLVLVSPCERAVWITKRHADEIFDSHLTSSGVYSRTAADGHRGYRCAMFRNEGAGLSSELVLAAVELTEQLWGPPPADGWTTYVDRGKIASANPGYCFKQAGWRLDRTFEHPTLVRLVLRRAPEPPPCYGVPKPNQRAGAHPMVPCEHLLDEAGIRVWRCPVCLRFLLEWLPARPVKVT